MPAQTEQYASQYFTGTQASIFVKDIWIDECFGVQLQASQSIIPLYGYASTFFDAAARGKVLVQGIFEINFVDEGYLYSVLHSTYNKEQEQEKTTDAIDIIQDNLELFEAIQNEGRDNPTVTARSRQDVMNSVLRDLASLSIAQADQFAARTQEAGRDITKNIIYDMVPFTLTGYFGHPEFNDKSQGTYKEIKNCFLVANEMVVAGNDEIIKERYSFIARSHI